MTSNEELLSFNKSLHHKQFKRCLCDTYLPIIAGIVIVMILFVLISKKATSFPFNEWKELTNTKLGTAIVIDYFRLTIDYFSEVKLKICIGENYGLILLRFMRIICKISNAKEV